MKQLIKYRILFAAAGVLALLAVFFPVLNAHATPEDLIAWEDTSRENEVSVRLFLPDKARLDEASTVELTFHLEGEAVSAAFLFDKQIAKDASIVVKEYFYNEEANDLTVFLSGRNALITKDGGLTIGRIQVDSDHDVKITVAEESCSMVDQYHDMEQMSGLGKVSDYTMNLGKTDAEVPTESDTAETETTKPESEEPGDTTPETEGRPTYTEDEDEEEPARNKNWITSGAVWQYRKADGTLARNEWILADGKWYRFNEEGTMQTGWIAVNGAWYFLNPSGEMKTGWVWDNSKWYYCGSAGAMKTGWIQDKTVWYHLQPSGAMDTGWVQDSGKWYYMGADGKMMTNTVTEDGYHLDRNGVCVEKK